MTTTILPETEHNSECGLGEIAIGQRYKVCDHHPITSLRGLILTCEGVSTTKASGWFLGSKHFSNARPGERPGHGTHIHRKWLTPTDLHCFQYLLFDADPACDGRSVWVSAENQDRAEELVKCFASDGDPMCLQEVCAILPYFSCDN